MTTTIEKEEKRRGYKFKIFVKGKELQTNFPPLFCTENEMPHLAIGMIYGAKLKYKTAEVRVYTIKDELVKTIF
jgi:hypothetical protein